MAEANREIIAVRAEDTGIPSPSGLGDKRTDTRVVSVDEETRTVLLDTANPLLPHLQQKLTAFADDSKISEKTGLRKSAPTVAAIRDITIASFDDLCGARLRAFPVPPDDLAWFEIACRGGRRATEEANAGTRAQILAGFRGLQRPAPAEYMATERLVFCGRLSPRMLEGLILRTDCIYEVDRATEELRNWALLEQQPLEDCERFVLTPPPRDAPSAVVLDTGIATQHPLLASALLRAESVVPGTTSPEDTEGHGTRMAGVALHRDVGQVLGPFSATPAHWLESVRLLTAPGHGTAREDSRPFWPRITEDAITTIEAHEERPRVYALAVTAEMLGAPRPTYWSHCLDQLAHNGGRGRLIVVSTGNAPASDLVHIQGYPSLSLQQKIEEPAQAASAITVGAYTRRTVLPPDPAFGAFRPVAPAGGISPHSRAGEVRPRDCIKPDVVFEGGNVATDGRLADGTVSTLVAISTGHQWRTHPLGILNGTSEATAQAAWFVAAVLREYPVLRPETVRALVIHSARWTQEMERAFPDIDERLAMCGHGVPDLERALYCGRDRATVLYEDEMPNALTEASPPEDRRSRGSARRPAWFRVAKFFRLPLPQELLLANAEEEVALRVTLSYFPEPNAYRRFQRSGLDLRWDMQGPQESPDQFRRRINRVARGGQRPTERTAPLGWELGLNKRSKGTVQSDHWRGPASHIAGDKMLAVYPVLGWWDKREELRQASMAFSLAVTVECPGIDIYNAISTELEAVIELDVEGESAAESV